MSEVRYPLQALPFEKKLFQVRYAGQFMSEDRVGQSPSRSKAEKLHLETT